MCNCGDFSVKHGLLKRRLDWDYCCISEPCISTVLFVMDKYFDSASDEPLHILRLCPIFGVFDDLLRRSRFLRTGRLLCESRSFENILAPFPRPVGKSAHHSRHSPQSARLPCFLPHLQVSSLSLTRNSSNTNIFIRNSQNDISNPPINVFQ